MSISETATREQLIDPLLRAAGWNLKDRTQVDFEIPVDGYAKEPLEWNHRLLLIPSSALYWTSTRRILSELTVGRCQYGSDRRAFAGVNEDGSIGGRRTRSGAGS